MTEIYYNADTEISFRTQYNSADNILKFTGYTLDSENLVTYNYENTEDSESVIRSDDFKKW